MANKPLKTADVHKAWLNRLKVIRAAVRLRYSLMADDELREIIPKERRAFDQSVLGGVLPEPLDTKKILDA